MTDTELTVNLKLIASALNLNRADIAEITTIGGIETSKSRADSWLRSRSSVKSATGNSDIIGQKIHRSSPVTASEFSAFCKGLKPWLDATEKE